MLNMVMYRTYTIAVVLLVSTASSAAWAQSPGNESPRTFCNPLNIGYRFQLDEPSRREAADPVIVLYRGDYYLFASKSGGYW